MDKKDLLGKKIKSIMEEETSELFLSDKIRQDILASTKPSFSSWLRGLLNSEVELPLVPISLGLAATVLLLIVPVEGFLKTPRVEIIDFGSSQVIIRDFNEVSER